MRSTTRMANRAWIAIAVAATATLLPSMSASAQSCDDALSDALSGVPSTIIDLWLMDGSISAGELADFDIILDCTDTGSDAPAEEPDPGTGEGGSEDPAPQPSADPAPSTQPAPTASQPAPQQSAPSSSTPDSGSSKPSTTKPSTPSSNGTTTASGGSASGAGKSTTSTGVKGSAASTTPQSQAAGAAQTAPAALDTMAAAEAVAETRESLPVAVAPNPRLLADPTSSVSGVIGADDSGLFAAVIALTFGAIATGSAAFWLQRRRKPARRSSH